jgi:hypothetical protein
MGAADHVQQDHWQQDHWQRIEELFYAALDLDPATRSAFLQEACGTDLELLKEVESLLGSSDTPAAP